MDSWLLGHDLLHCGPRARRFSYIYMVAAWGGFIFVLNLIALHALLLVPLGRFNAGVSASAALDLRACADATLGSGSWVESFAFSFT